MARVTRELALRLLTVENLRRSTSRTSLVTFEWIEFGCVHKLNPNAYLHYRVPLYRTIADINIHNE